MFYDFAHGSNRNVAVDSPIPARVRIASVGVGLRYTLGKNVSLRFDLAQVIDAGPVGTKDFGDRRGYVTRLVSI